MKNFTMRSMFAVAALAVAAGSASAQTYKAEIPMAFHAGDRVMEAGSYTFQVSVVGTGRAVILLRSATTAASASLMPLGGNDVPKAWRAAPSAKVSFACVEGTCTLSGLWDGRDVIEYKFSTPKLRATEKESIAEVTLALHKVD